MAPLPRFELLGHPQHVIIRGNNRQIIFVADEDYFFPCFGGITLPFPRVGKGEGD